MKVKPRILLVDYANFESCAELPAVFDNADCDVDILCDRRSWLKRNKYWQKWIVCDKNEELFFNQVKEIAASNTYDWIILGDDLAIRIVNDRVKDEELFYKLLPISKIEDRAILGSKAGLSRICQKHGLKTPAYLIYGDIKAEQEIVEQLRFPMMLKLDRSEAGLGIFYCYDERSLFDSLKGIEDKRGLVIQEYITGDLIGVEVLYKNGELLAYNHGNMTRTLYNELSISTERLFYTSDEMEEELKKLGKLIGVNGFGNLTYIYNKEEQEHYLIEVDLRPQAWIYYGKFCGVDFSEAVRKYLSNERSMVQSGEKNKDKKQVVVHYARDIMRCILKRDVIGLLKWIFNVNGRWKFIPFYDRRLLYYTHVVIYQFLKNNIKYTLRAWTGKAPKYSNSVIIPADQDRALGSA